MTDLKRLQHELGEMQITVRELMVLEDYEGADYSECLNDIKWVHKDLMHRLTTLKNRR